MLQRLCFIDKHNFFPVAWNSGNTFLVITVSLYLKVHLLWDSILITVCSLAEGDSDNYIAYYRRATVYLAMGKSKAAIRDLSKVVELKQDFTSVSITGIENCSSVRKTCFEEGCYFRFC